MAINKTTLDSLRAHAKVFQSLIDVVGELERIGSIEQAASEAQARYDKALAGEVDAQQALQTSLRELDEARSQALTVLKDSSLEAAEIVSSAIVEAETRKAYMQAEMDKYRDDANAACLQARIECAEAQEATSVAKAALADLEKRIERAKAKISDLLGAGS
jgi:Na+/phosphate symporter